MPGELHAAEGRVAHEHAEGPLVAGDGVGGSALLGHLAGPLQGLGVLGIDEVLPLIEQARVGLADHLAQPLHEVGQLLGAGGLRDGA